MRPGRSPAAGPARRRRPATRRPAPPSAVATTRHRRLDGASGLEAAASRCSTSPPTAGSPAREVRLAARPGRRRRRDRCPTCPTELTVAFGADDGGEPVGPTDGRPPRRRAPRPYYPLRFTLPTAGVGRSSVPTADRRQPSSSVVRCWPADGCAWSPARATAPRRRHARPSPTPGASTPSARPSRRARSTTGQPRRRRWPPAGRCALLVSTPAFCQTGICGPVLDLLRGSGGRPPAVAVRPRRGLHRPRRRRRPPPTSRPALGLTFEPCLFLVGRGRHGRRPPRRDLRPARELDASVLEPTLEPEPARPATAAETASRGTGRRRSVGAAPRAGSAEGLSRSRRCAGRWGC